MFEGNPNGKFFTRWYIDAFAGTGDRVESGTEEQREKVRDGSAKIALSTNPPFQKFLFIESDPKKVAALKALSDEYRSASVSVRQGDANVELQEWCRTVTQRDRAVVFIDPYGMQLNWETLKRLAETCAVDIWILIPLGIAVNRLLTKRGLPPEAWANRLTRFLGIHEWQKFYREDPQISLFDPPELIRDASIEKIGTFILERLNTIFLRVSDTPYVIRNSRGNPMYLFCFAASNQKGAQVGMKIANDILEKAHYGR